ncbi:MAG TPA: hypothetical protein PKN27_12435, partial [Propionibacteriaceae bacterium]|nr:hypothetical protein [Propionibacteriaceae bacterium]
MLTRAIALMVMLLLTTASLGTAAPAASATIVGEATGWGARPASSPPKGLTGVTGIAAGASHTLTLGEDGTVDVWSDPIYIEVRVPDGLSGVTAVAAASTHSMALKSDGTVVAWG